MLVTGLPFALMSREAVRVQANRGFWCVRLAGSHLSRLAVNRWAHYSSCIIAVVEVYHVLNAVKREFAQCCGSRLRKITVFGEFKNDFALIWSCRALG